MSDVKLCEVIVYFSSDKRKRDVAHFACCNEIDFCKNIDIAKNSLISRFGLSDVRINGIEFKFLEVIS